MNRYYATWGTALVLSLTSCKGGQIGDLPLVDSGVAVDSSTASPDAREIPDARPPDAAVPDAALPDAAVPDAAIPDAAPVPDAPRPCIEGDDQVVDPTTGHCYLFFAQLATWDAARVACQVLDAHLVVSTSRAENDRFSPLAGLADVWVGGNDKSVEMTWVWLNGEPMSYTNWRTGEPNNSDANDPTGEDCMIIEGDNGGLWDDRSCQRTYGFICERE